ncbi:MAG TPA: DUF3025 domain-containing protein [Polyangiales bacterium]
MSVGRNTPYRARIYEESPWYASIAEPLAELERVGRFPSAEELSALHAARVQARGLPALRFVEAPRNKPRRPKGQPIALHELYEGQVVERSEVPTRRDDWHDLFNALAFITFPRAKQALHARQYRIMAARLPPRATKLPNARTREQDALALFDEGGLIVASPAPVGLSDEALADALRNGRARVVPFGHALHEHLVARAPCPLATAHAIQLDAETLHGEGWLDAVDSALARALGAPTAFLAPSPERGNSLPALLAR